MLRSDPFRISLARKCQLLFGLAVLLIIAAALYVPGTYMETLVHELNLRDARSLAITARVWADPSASDWPAQQELLDKWWEDNTNTLRLPATKPRLIPLNGADRVLTGFTLVALYEQMRDPMRKLKRIARELEPWCNPPPQWLLARGALVRVAAEWRAGLQARAPGMLLRLTRQWVDASDRHPTLDRFQVQCVADMLRDERLNERHQAIRRADHPTIYQFVLAVRAAEPGAGKRPLVGIIDVKLPTNETQEVFWTRIILGLAGLLAGFLAILVFYLISQKLILAPVRELKDLVTRITEGDQTARANLTTGDEYEELSDAFNDMLTELEKSRLELETINRSLDAKLGELAETNVALHESNRLKSEFLANVSHELRTPLTSIIGFGDLLRDMAQDEGEMDTKRLARYATNILTSGRMLLDIINDLLDLAKIEAGKIRIHRTQFSLCDLCEALGDFLQPMIDKKKQSFTIVLDDKMPLMTSDSGKIRQVLFNLLSNAIKYTPEQGAVGLETHVLDSSQRVRLVVWDTGPGIRTDDQDRIFEKFQQLDASVTRKFAGTGLGLPISRDLCLLLGGTVRVESQPGSGARFIIELPVDCPDNVTLPLPTLT